MCDLLVRAAVNTAGDMQAMPMQRDDIADCIGNVEWDRLPLLRPDDRPEVAAVDAKRLTGGSVTKVMGRGGKQKRDALIDATQEIGQRRNGKREHAGLRATKAGQSQAKRGATTQELATVHASSFPSKRSIERTV